MKPSPATLSSRAVFAVVLCVAALAMSCTGADSPVGTDDGGVATLLVRPALIPSPANAAAEPIDRIRAVTMRVADDVEIDSTVLDVSPSPSPDDWDVALSITTPEYLTVTVTVELISVAPDGTEQLEFSGGSDAISLVSGGEVSASITMTRGPLDNLLVTSVSIPSAPGTIVEGTSQTLSADVAAGTSAVPVVFWTSLDPRGWWLQLAASQTPCPSR